MRFFYLVLLIFLSPINIFAKNCASSSLLKIGLIENDYIDYKRYLYHALGHYGANSKTEFEISIVNNNIDEFDIIFGEYIDLQNFTLYEIDYPDEILEFYQKNNILIKNNLLPLDLDTFIIMSKDKIDVMDLYELEILHNPSKYTLGLSLKDEINVIKLLNFINQNNQLDINNLSTEISFNFFEKINQNLNNNTLDSNILEIMSSYENSENIFTLFSDGTLLYKDLEYGSFQLFPHRNKIWDNERGYFKKNFDMNPISFYGLSAYINNSTEIGFICYILDKNVRINSFKNFNIELSPFSLNEVEPIKNEIPEQYIEILKIKNNFIADTNSYSNLKYYDYVKEIILNKKKYRNFIAVDNYLD